MRVFVILPAAGIGTRMSGGSGAGSSPSTPKQFLSIAGVPVLVHCLRAFAAAPRAEAIFVAVRKPEIQRVRAQAPEFGLGNKICVVERADLRQHPLSNPFATLIADTGCGQDHV